MSMKIWIEGTRQFGCQSKLPRRLNKSKRACLTGGNQAGFPRVPLSVGMHEEI